MPWKSTMESSTSMVLDAFTLLHLFMDEKPEGAVRCINTNINFVFEFSGTTLMENKSLGIGFFKGRGNEWEDHLLLLFWCCYSSSVFYTYRACRGSGVGRMSCVFFFFEVFFHLVEFTIPSKLPQPFC